MIDLVAVHMKRDEIVKRLTKPPAHAKGFVIIFWGEGVS